MASIIPVFAKCGSVADSHHGNGTQAAFYDDPSILQFHTHDYGARDLSP